jgi:hypothetical protein
VEEVVSSAGEESRQGDEKAREPVTTFPSFPFPTFLFSALLFRGVIAINFLTKRVRARRYH